MALTRLQDTEGIAKDIENLAKDLERLRLSYEQYFLGLEKEEPQKQRTDISALIRKYTGTHIQNARLKFKLDQSIAKYNSYCTYWNRILRDIEEGRHTRDLFRARLHEKEPPKTPAAQTPGPAKATPGSEDPVNSLFKQYVDAKTKCNESTKGLTLEGFKKSLTQQLEIIKKKTNNAPVRFQVVTENGRAILRATTAKSN